jgi:hypothetical protein
MNPFQCLKIFEEQKGLRSQLILFLNHGLDKPGSETFSRATLYQKRNQGFQVIVWSKEQRA